MNPLNFEGAKEIVGKAAEATYGINPYEDEDEGDDKYANLDGRDDIYSQNKQEE